MTRLPIAAALLMALGATSAALATGGSPFTERKGSRVVGVLGCMDASYQTTDVAPITASWQGRAEVPPGSEGGHPKRRLGRTTALEG